MGHRCCSKQKVKRGLWSPEEDEKLVKYVATHGHGCWSTVPKQAGLQRCGKSCRLRWINYLRPDLKRGYFSLQEEQTIIDAHRVLGNRWAQISRHLPGRTDNEVKNFWNSCMRKKLLAQGIDPKTHRRISELEMHEHRPLTCSHEPSSGFGQYSSYRPNSDLELGEAMREGIMSKFAYTRDAVSGENLGLSSYGLVPVNASCEQDQTLQEETKFHSQANDGEIEISRSEEKPHFPFDKTLSAHIEQLDIGSSSYESDHPLISPVNELEAAMRFKQMNPPSLEADFKPMHLPKLVNENEFNSQQLQASNYYQYQNQNQYLISYSSSASSAYGEHHLDADLSLDSSIPFGIYFGMIP